MERDLDFILSRREVTEEFPVGGGVVNVFEIVGIT
jgi:hypothetical protein